MFFYCGFITATVYSIGYKKRIQTCFKKVPTNFAVSTILLNHNTVEIYIAMQCSILTTGCYYIQISQHMLRSQVKQIQELGHA